MTRDDEAAKDPFGPRPPDQPAVIVRPLPLDELPPVGLAPPDELERDVLASPSFARLGSFVRWAGTGRKLTKKHNLLKADAPGLIELLRTEDVIDSRIGDTIFRTKSTTELRGIDYIYRLARAAGLVRVAKGTVSATRAGRAAATDPLNAWLRALEGFVKMRYVAWRYPEGVGLGRPFWSDDVDRTTPDLLNLLYARRAPVPFDEIVELQWSEISEEFDLHVVPPDRLEWWHSLVESDIQSIVDELQDLGAVRRDGALRTVRRWKFGGGYYDEEFAPGAEAPETGPRTSLIRRGGEVSLTPLGVWGTNRMLRRQGYRAPAIGDHALQDAVALLYELKHYDRDELEAEVRAWAAVRGDRAAEELVTALRICRDPELRLCAAGALAVVHTSSDDPAAVERLVRELLDIPDARTFALAWLLERGLVDHSAMGSVDALSMFVDGVAVIARAEGPRAAVEAIARLGPVDHQRDVIGKLWSIRTAQSDYVLETFAHHHPDPGAAKEARKALFKLRSAGE